MFEKELRNFLKEYDCNPELLEYVLKCKSILKEFLEGTEKYVDPVKLETSIKVFENGTEVKGRYVIGITSEEFKMYTLEQRTNLFKIAGFDIDNFEKLLKVDKEFILYIGGDNGKGKVYFDSYNLCFESTGIIKNYNFIKPGWIHVTNLNEPNIVTSVYKIIRDDDGVMRWYSIADDYITTYFRPLIKVSEEVFKDLTKQELYDTQHMYLWYCVTCPCCFENQDENNGEDKSISKEEIISRIKQDFKKLADSLLKCIKCNNNKFLDFKTDDTVTLDDGTYNNNIVLCDVEETCICCQKCGTYYILCSKCNNIMQFLGHDDPYDDHDNFDLEVENLDLNKIGYSYLNECIFHVDQKTIIKNHGDKLTGPDGGFHHYWRCNKCDKCFKFSDK